jgi:hypothetical protein
MGAGKSTGPRVWMREPVCRAVALLLAPYAEVVLRDPDADRVLAVWTPMTSRGPGDRRPLRRVDRWGRIPGGHAVAVTLGIVATTMGGMPSPRHDALVQLFRDRPQLAVEILRDLMGVELPATPLVRLESTSFNTRPSGDLEADVVAVMGPPQSPAHAIIVEIQQDKTKSREQLARYAAALWLMLGCDVTVLAICPDAGVAVHYAEPIHSGLSGYRFQARVLGPEGIPAIIDPQLAASQPELSAMSVMVHGRDRKVVEAFTAALAELPDEHAPKYYEYAYSMSAPEVRRLLEEIMASTAWPVFSPFAREHYGRGLEEGRTEGKAEGKAEGKTEEAARLVLLVLAARGLDVPDDTRARITTCMDLAQLEAWAAHAATADKLEDLFRKADV